MAEPADRRIDADEVIGIARLALEVRAAEQMDVSVRRLGEMGWIPRSAGISDSIIHETWQNGRDAMVHVHTGSDGPRFYFGVLIHSYDDSELATLFDAARSAIMDLGLEVPAGRRENSWQIDSWLGGIALHLSQEGDSKVPGAIQINSEYAHN